MADYQVFYFKFTGPLHISDERPDDYARSEVIFHSDTLMAAVMAAWAKMGKEEWIPRNENDDAGFVLSSTFPYMEEGPEIVHFFPRVRSRFNFKNADYEPTLAKVIKKVQWLDQGYFEKYLNGESFSADESVFRKKQNYISTKVAHPRELFQKQEHERVNIPRDRSKEETQPFYMEQVYFPEGGLFCLAQGKELERVRQALVFLQTEGLGTDRSIGNGLFEFSEGEIQLQVPEQTDYAVNLGLYCPESKEELQKTIMHDQKGYNIVRRGGWMSTAEYTGTQKNSIYMFEEGSILKTPNDIIGRRNIDLRPQRVSHPVWRSGQSICLPINIDI